MNKKQIIIIVVALVLIAGIVWFYFKKAKPIISDTQLNNTINTTPGETNTTLAVVPNDNFPLVKGSEGENVVYLQQALKKLNPNLGITSDGIFGPQTYNAVLLTVGTSYYPVTQANFTKILTLANNI